MYLTAHRVRTKDNQTGVNAFLHEHGTDTPWPLHPVEILSLPRTDPGKLTRSSTGLESRGGLPVLSYLDVLAPDETPRGAIVDLIDLLAATDPGDHGGLLVLVKGRLATRLSLPRWRLDAWREELDLLTAPIEDLLRSRTWRRVAP